ncbi:MAG: hypothetical protein H7Z75_17685 [Ferruginibacter sp.]|nr:hypothetical protein [Cytophagales bacterium]
MNRAFRVCLASSGRKLSFLAGGNAHRWALVLGWLLIQTLLYQRYGVKIANDSARYLAYAQDIAQRGYFEPGHNLRYVGYCLFVAAVLETGAGTPALVLAQMALSGLAAVALYATARHLSGSTRAAAGAAWCFLLWPDLQYWNCYVLTESLFISFMLFSLAATVLGKTRWPGWLAVGIVGFTATIRPNGFVVPLAALGYAFARIGSEWKRHPWPRAVFFIPLVLVSLFATYWLLDTYWLRTFGITGIYPNGWIIYGWDGFRILPDQPPRIPDASVPPVKRLLTVIGQNPLYFLKVASVKALLFVGYAKPYFSPLHNAAIVLLVYPLYFLAGKAFWNGKLALPVRVYLGLVLLLHVLMVALTYEDWDCRFSIPLLPLVFVAASVEASYFGRKLR